MALTADDFALTPAQLQALNDYIAERVRAYAQAGEDMDMPSINVSFDFVHIFGRRVTVSFDGATPGHVIDNAWGFDD